MLEAITQKVDSSAVGHPNGTKVAGTFADRPMSKLHRSIRETEEDGTSEPSS